ncbi:MAG: TonB-dependent receptor, partial [Pseudomonadota bacterium]
SAHFSQGFKLPSFFALGSTLVGNPDLVPEESEHYSIALNHDVSERFTIGGTLFKNEFENLIEFDAALFTNVNLSTVDVQGLEIEATALPLDTLSVSVFGIWSEYEINGASALLRLRPESQIGMDAVWDVSDTWLVSARAAYTGSREDNFLAAGNLELEEYVTFDVNSIWEFADDKRIKLGVLNLFDEDYQETFGNPAKEARLYFALEGDF